MRARNIKPGYFKNDRLAELPALTRILFSGLWCIADKAGRLEDRPKRIKADVLPYDDGDVDGMLWQLHETGFITRYEVEGIAYIQVTNFDKHQNPHKNESPSSIPCPEQHRNNPVQAPESSRTNPADSLIPDSLIPDSLCADSREDAAAPEETVDSGESIELSPAERRIIANVRQIPGMAAVPESEIALHFREIVTARGSPPSESAFITDSMNFRDHWTERRRQEKPGAKFTGWRNAMTNWFSRTKEVADTRRSPHAAPKDPMATTSGKSYSTLFDNGKAAS